MRLATMLLAAFLIAGCGGEPKDELALEDDSTSVTASTDESEEASAEADKLLENVDPSNQTEEGEVIGQWSAGDDSESDIKSIHMIDGKYVLRTTKSDGRSRDSQLKKLGNKFYDITAATGEYYIIESDGNLAAYRNDNSKSGVLRKSG
jgi:hypothetical protein